MEYRLSIQYISDIHLEFYKQDETFNITPYSYNLALCGDIGYPDTENYINFIKHCSEKFKNVFVIFGNHEYYNRRNTVIIKTMDDKKKYAIFPSNVHFLDNNIVYLDILTNTVYKTKPFDLQFKKLVKIIGSTLWSDIDQDTSLKINDINFIYKEQRCPLTYKEQRCPLTYIDIKMMFKTNINWILNEIKKEPSIKCILLTHHSVHPIFMDPDIYENPRKQLKNAYTNEIPELYEMKNLIICICGHTHHTIKIKMNFKDHYIFFLSNQVGYNFEKNKKTNHIFGAKYLDPNDPFNCLFITNI